MGSPGPPPTPPGEPRCSSPGLKSAGYSTIAFKSFSFENHNIISIYYIHVCIYQNDIFKIKTRDITYINNIKN